MPPFAFWYIYTSNGTDGFLLDLMRRPTEAAARLAIYHEGLPPRIVRHTFKTTDLSGIPGELGVRLGGIALDALGCRSTLEDMPLDAQFALSGRGMRFVPSWVSGWFPQVPAFQSTYGVLKRATCAAAQYEDAPLVCSTYYLEDLSNARWVLLSAPHFQGSDLAFEISATRLLGRWLPTAWVFFGGREYRLNSPLDSVFRVRIDRAGEIEDGQRVFHATIRAGGLALDIDARGPLDQFAQLDAEGQTEIHTTLFGTCRGTAASKSAAARTFIAERTCLLEIKN